MSYDELCELHSRLVDEIMGRPEWGYVLVPAGEYIVGEHIPASVYSMRPAGVICIIAVNEREENYSVNQGQTIGQIELEDGDVVEIGSGGMYFMPFVGLGF